MAEDPTAIKENAQDNGNTEALSALALTFRNHLRQFSDHLLVLEEIFFFEDRRHEDLFMLSVRLLNPAVPFTVLEQEGAQNRFARLAKAFEQSCASELARFAKESDAVRHLYQEMMAAEERRWKESEASRQDEFIALSQLCRREVSATIAKIKAETAQTTTELDAIESLQVALQAKTTECETVRKSLDALVLAHEADRQRWLGEITKERDLARSLLHSDREAFSQQIREHVKQSESERRKHHDEMVEQQRRSSEQYEQVRRKLMELQEENDKLRHAMDTATVERGREQRMFSEERNRLLRTITDLEVSYDSLRRSLQDAECDAQRSQMEFEHQSETKKLLELQAFKKRLTDTTRLLSASMSSQAPASSAMASPRSSRSHRSDPLSPNPVVANRGDSVRSVSDTATSHVAPYRESSTSVLKAMSGVRALTPRDASRSPGTALQLRSPSETFLRLSNMVRHS